MVDPLDITYAQQIQTQGISPPLLRRRKEGEEEREEREIEKERGGHVVLPSHMMRQDLLEGTIDHCLVVFENFFEVCALNGVDVFFFSAENKSLKSRIDELERELAQERAKKDKKKLKEKGKGKEKKKGKKKEGERF